MTNESSPRRFSRRDVAMVLGGIVMAVIGFGLWIMFHGTADESENDATAATTAKTTSSDELTVRPDVLTGAGVEVASVVRQPRVERVAVSGTVQANEQQMQEVTPLVSGRVERLSVVEGSVVQSGAVLLTMSSPEVAELQGNLRTAEAKRAEAEATLTRTRRLVELGAGAGKDLVAAESEQRAAQAEVAQLRERLATLGAAAGSGEAVAATTTVRAPATATVIERHVNPGQWIEPGTAVIKLANLSTVWVMASIPESRLPAIAVGAPVEIRVAALEGAVLRGKVAYIESELDAETRTAPVRIEVANPGQRLRIGMFVEVTIQGRHEGGEQLMIPSTAVQRIGERTVVFAPLEETGTFRIRDVELGEESDGTRVVLNGLQPGERVVTKGGFTLKSQLLKGQFGEDEELGGEER